MTTNPHHKPLSLVFAVLLALVATGSAALAAPGEATNLAWCPGSKTCLQWTPVSAASRYGVYRGVGTQLPQLLTAGVDSCELRPPAASPSASSLSEDPAPGDLYWYVVVAENPCGQGSPGAATTGPRILNSSGYCASWCADAALDGDETDTDCGGSCAPCANGMNCSLPGDCASGRCAGGQCQLDTCSDGIANGQETGVDCGGPCLPCANGGGCCAGTDCQSGICSGELCGASPCANGVQDGTETDIDCGGGTCAPCATGQGCQVGADCTSRVCSPATHTCQNATCSDGVKNGSETDVDCGGGGCAACPLAKQCAGGTDCQSGFCVDGVCCNNACTGTCSACTTAKKGSGSNGSCGLIGSGLDPDNECAGSGVCNGLGACRSEPNGSACASGTECATGFCFDGFCCDQQCSGTCQACSAAKKGSGADGTCGSIGAGLDPDNECAGAAVCGGSGTCVSPNGAACAANASCQSGFCVDGFCCDAACNGFCQACSAVKKGSGANGACGLVGFGLDPDNECSGAAVCNGAGACASPDGATCTVGSNCINGNCVDGVCCNTPCTGTCQACSASKTGSSSGFCTNIVTGTDPDNECPGTAYCSAGACVSPNGSACSANANCASGFCIDGVCCNNACSGLCAACTAAKKGGGSDGSCGPINPGTDPDNECAGASTCTATQTCSP